MINIQRINQTKSFESILNAKTQVDYYINNNAHSDILKIVVLNNKSFGERMQRIIMELLSLNNSNKSSHDIQLNCMGIKFEVKSSRFWVGTGDWKWQHIMENHDYDYLLLCGVNFNGIDLFIISKSEFLTLKSKGMVTQQGGAEGQGLWCNYKSIKDYLTQITTVEDLNDYINRTI